MAINDGSHEQGPVLDVGAGYTLWAPLYDDDGNPLTALEGPLIRSWIGEVAGRRVLDLGCGTGRHTEALAAARAEVVAVDPTAAMLERARAKLAGVGAVEWLRAGLPGPLPFDDSTFALVVMGLVAEHIADMARGFAEVARVLEPGGRLLLSALHPERTEAGQSARFIDPATGSRRPIETFHRSTDDYLRLAHSAGLDLIEESTLVVDERLGRELPRAARYVGVRLGWAAAWRRLDPNVESPAPINPTSS
ncbi:MAG: class I SAM-dependent methyltransferase [Isosphaeraceae bacterium]|nr:class I SAM-dependent methyltransferase [Isosphaeraceae bacterium]